MRAIRSFNDYLPQPADEKQVHLLQAKVEKSLWDQANVAREKDGLTWRAIAEAALKSYLDARKK